MQRRNFGILILAPDAQIGADLARVGAWVAEKKVQVVVDSTVLFTAVGVAEGYGKMVGRSARGKVVAVMVAF